MRYAMDEPGSDNPQGPWLDLLKEILLRMPRYVSLGWALARAPEIPGEKKTGLLGGVLYSVSPIDPVPGFIPVLGQLDDLAALLFGIRYALRHCPPELGDRLLADNALSREQLDRDLRTLIPIARGFSMTVARGAWRGSRAVGRAVGRGVAKGSRALWRMYKERNGRLAVDDSSTGTDFIGFPLRAQDVPEPDGTPVEWPIHAPRTTDEE